MLPFKKDDIITAYFDDVDHTIIAVEYNNQNGELVMFYLSNNNQDVWNDFVNNYVSMDSILDNTHTKRKTDGKAFHDFATNVAVEQGWVAVADNTPISTNQIIKLLFNPTEDILSKEQLFELKLALFERDEVKTASREVKASIRKAQTVSELIKIVIQSIDNLNTTPAV